MALYGNQINLKGGGVSLNGVVNYQVGGGAAMPALTAANVINPSLITPLTWEEKTPEIQDLQINLIDFYGNELSGHFERFKGLKWTLLSDCGEERNGVEGHLLRTATPRPDDRGVAVFERSKSVLYWAAATFSLRAAITL